MDKNILIYMWVLSVGAAFFFGGEATMMKHNLDRKTANLKLQNCNKIIAGGE